MDFIKMIESPHKEFELTKPNAKVDTILYNAWKGLKVRKFHGAVVITNTAKLKSAEIGDFLPLSYMVTTSEWTTILEKSEDNA